MSEKTAKVTILSIINLAFGSAIAIFGMSSMWAEIRYSISVVAFAVGLLASPFVLWLAEWAVFNFLVRRNFTSLLFAAMVLFAPYLFYLAPWQPRSSVPLLMSLAFFIASLPVALYWYYQVLEMRDWVESKQKREALQN